MKNNFQKRLSNPQEGILWNDITSLFYPRYRGLNLFKENLLDRASSYTPVGVRRRPHAWPGPLLTAGIIVGDHIIPVISIGFHLPWRPLCDFDLMIIGWPRSTSRFLGEDHDWPNALLMRIMIDMICWWGPWLTSRFVLVGHHRPHFTVEFDRFHAFVDKGRYLPHAVLMRTWTACALSDLEVKPYENSLWWSHDVVSRATNNEEDHMKPHVSAVFGKTW